ncbi:MAG TPA: hypothetical protein VFB25_01575 [Gaiellaceae bacterium]|nr:hypothetical protein [Gaiellaceae bacterium]
MRSRTRSARILALALLGFAGLAAAFALGTPVLKGGHNAKLGAILVDAKGRTLYHLTSEAPGQIKCTGICASFWIPVYATGKGKPALGKGVVAAKVGTIKRGGKLQLTYNKMPLYRYYLDKQPGQIRGQGIGEGTGRWFAISLAGKVVKKGGGSGGGTTPGTTTGTSTGGYGY